jgi:hypothetical protein
VRRTMPTAKPSPMARPATPAKATPAKSAPVKPAPAPVTPAKPAPAKVTPAKPKPAADDDGFDLRSLVDDEPATGSQPALAAAAAPAKDDDDDLDALFDEIQIGDK